ncbi:transketolase family protein [Hydrocarboniclastica marina]|uniref:Transketolase family protein n=1 Tax=Hydrocarboniclastica marina TaxID=2259620 RepID=A0A4P7XFY5_9ALTE|nr:transketolase family protein [Hydrocarboniclastica marina]MAL97115.1 transketolase [Alteromonadaceae bacterium]QCF25523.1 transketolase family protein [Hydrocarboniclastica marina]|tara:strand:- start:5992 stop:6981 length:990 start_codon:yes stop_codon:yes gene_type:complete
MSAEAKANAAPALVGQQSDSLREAFGKAISQLAETDTAIVVLDADVAGGTGAHHFRKRHPDRFVQCGIAEQNMVGVAAGMAHRGLKPFVTTFAVFMMRGLEQIRLSVAYSGANVKLIASHPGLDVGPDGASAQCLEDLACMRAIPNMVVLSPCDAHEVAAATRALANYEGPAYMRTGRSPCPNVFDAEPEFTIGKGRVLREGRDLTLVGCGVMTQRALVAAEQLAKEGVSARVVHMPSIKPIDRELLIESARSTQLVVTCEDHNIIGGLGSAVAEVLSEVALVPVRRIGVEDVIGGSGEPDELAQHYGLDAVSIISKTLAFYRELNSHD